LGVMGLWTIKMVYLVPTQYFLIQLQLINHFFFNSLTNEKQKGVTMHSSIIIFACFSHLKSLSVLSLLLFRTFLYSLSRNGAMSHRLRTMNNKYENKPPDSGTGKKNHNRFLCLKSHIAFFLS